MDIPKEIRMAFSEKSRACEEYRQDFYDYLSSHSVEDVIQKYYFYGTPFVFRDDVNKYFELRKDIAKHFEIDPSDIFMVGSSKLGFSLAPDKDYREWTEESDIDIAIVDADLFDRFWKELYLTPIFMRPRFVWEDESYKSFLEYFFKGWLRPDMMPDIERQPWFDFFASLYGKYGYKVTAGIYRKKDYLKAYHLNNIKRVKEDKLK